MLPDDDNVVRYCPKGKQTEDRKPAVTAFYLNKEGDDGLSVNWIEYFRLPALAEALASVRSVMKGKNYTLRKSGLFALINVGGARKAALKNYNRQLQITHDPKPHENDYSHSTVVGYRAKNDIQLALVLKEQTNGVYPGLAD